MATKTVTKRKASKPAEESSARKAKPAQESTAFGPIAERFRRAGDYERAISLCREGLEKFPNHASARVTLGWALLETGKYDEARVELEQVLRRAPDNLAAIRGLAELHDRSEHTMNLPMDGPGQWPPSAAAIDGQPADEQAKDEADAEDGAGTIVAKARTAKPVNPAPAVIAPAELGLAMWSPVDIEPARAAAPAKQTGMSSVREIDPDAVVVQAESPAEPQPVASTEPVVAEPPQTVAAEPTDAEIAALIAEAEALEAAAQEPAQEFQSTIVLDSSVDLSELVDETQFVPEPFEVGGEIVARAEPQVVPEPEVVAEPEVVPEPELAVEPAPVAEPEVVVEAAHVPDPELLIGTAQFAEPEVVVEAAQVAEPEPEVVVEAAQVIQPEVFVETPAVVEPEPEFEPHAVAAFEAVAKEPQRKPALIALERLLRKVQTRRLQLVSESVA